MSHVMLAKDIFVGDYPEVIAKRMGWAVKDDAEFWYIEMPSEDYPLYEFIFEA